MGDPHGLSSKTMASAFHPRIYPMYLSGSIEEIHPEPVPLAGFGGGSCLPRRRLQLLGGRADPRGPPPKTSTTHPRQPASTATQHTAPRRIPPSPSSFFPS